MREYKKVTKTYETEEISKCVCDKCGVECVKTELDTCTIDKRSILQLRPQYNGEDAITFDLCPNCTRELLKWFPHSREIKEFVDTLDIWEDD